MSQNYDAEGTVSVPSCGLEDRPEAGREARQVSMRFPRAREHEGERDKFPAKPPVSSSRGEIEAAICSAINRFERDYLGHGPVNIRAHLIGDLLIVRLKGVLTAAEKQLVKTHLPERGRELLKQVRMAIIDTTRPVIDPIVETITGAKVLSVHHDINVAGDEFIIFTLASAPDVRGRPAW